jgi:myxalamid-type nonribosomal peptide synthetase MxaA
MKVPVSARHSRSILLTGATGFVGRFLLAQLLQESDSVIYCLVRADSRSDAAARIKSRLLESNLWRYEYEPRIVPIPGDLSCPRLATCNDDYRACLQMDAIYHCGASVNHLETYEMAKAANVAGTQELIRIATRGTIKPLQYISTLGVFSNRARNGPCIVSERTPLGREGHPRSSGYVASKLVAESMILKARALGIPCNIFRLGLLWADSRHGRFDELQHVHRLLKTCMMIGAGIENYHFPQDPVPVDYAARAVVALSKADHITSGTFHITSSSQAPDGLFEYCNLLLKAPLRLMTFYDWIQGLKRLHRAGHSLPITPLLEFTFSMRREEFAEYLRLSKANSVWASCQETCRELAKLGIGPPPPYQDSIAPCLEHMAERKPELWSPLHSTVLARHIA